MHVLCDPCRESNTSLLACRRDWPLTQARTGFLVVHPALVILMSRCMHCGWNTSTELCQKAYTRVYHILQNQARICSPTLYLTKLYRRSSRLCNSVHPWEHVSEIRFIKRTLSDLRSSALAVADGVWYTTRNAAHLISLQIQLDMTKCALNIAPDSKDAGQEQTSSLWLVMHTVYRI